MESQSGGGGERPQRGSVYRCPVCASVLSVVRACGVQAHMCCNTDMVLSPRINPVYFCKVCGSELMLIRGDPKGLQAICCNESMSVAVAGTV